MKATFRQYVSVNEDGQVVISTVAIDLPNEITLDIATNTLSRKQSAALADAVNAAQGRGASGGAAS